MGGKQQPELRSNVVRIQRIFFCPLKKERASIPRAEDLIDGVQVRASFRVQGRPMVVLKDEEKAPQRGASQKGSQEPPQGK